MNQLTLSMLPGALLLCAVTLAPLAQAAPCTTTCYVAPNGDNGADGNSDTPFASINRGIGVVAPGGTVKVQSGVYLEWVQITKDNLTLEGESQANTYLLSPYSNNRAGIQLISPRRGITVRGFTVSGFLHGVQLASASNQPVSDVLLEDLRLNTNAGSGVHLLTSAFSENITLRRVTASYSDLKLPQRGIYMAGGPRRNITIEDCTIFNNGISGIDMNIGSTNGLIIRNNQAAQAAWSCATTA